MKLADVKSNTYINSSKEINNKDPKFKVGDIVRISKYKKIFTKGYAPNWSEDVFVIKKVKNTFLWTSVLVILMEKILLEHIMKKELHKTSQKEFRVKNVIKRKGDTLYVKSKGYHNFFNSWIDKKDICE